MFLFKIYFIIINSVFICYSYRIAIVGDVGLNVDARKNLLLIKKEADVLIHNGDFDYISNPKRWNQFLDETVGKKFPIYAVLGNHELGNNEDDQKLALKYIQYHKKRMNIIQLHCSKDTIYLVKSNCMYKNVQIIQVAIGIRFF